MPTVAAVYDRLLPNFEAGAVIDADSVRIRNKMTLLTERRGVASSRAEIEGLCGIETVSLSLIGSQALACKVDFEE